MNGSDPLSLSACRSEPQLPELDPQDWNEQFVKEFLTNPDIVVPVPSSVTGKPDQTRPDWVSF